ncbi:hypothetical protein C8F04DRAFT_1272112 [Mycena alexandri]|uniref:Uncharacterized protein n=1 Tax=Mycena alexandri TaxID=1745969 RepID=A0AAD6S811_9AGAR|nr:hypothetical protein C8F04DRAFT_1272112 [Mycena alexandri]
MGVCKYFVFMERMYNKRSQPVRAYPRRGSSAPPPPDIVHKDDEDSMPSGSSSAPPSSQPRRRAREDSIDSTPVRPFKRRNIGGSSSTVVGSSSPINPFIVPSATPEPLPKLESAFAMLMQLDANSNAGLTEAQFRKLFVRCSVCRLFTTASAFEYHTCRPVPTRSIDIIDLTSDD